MTAMVNIRVWVDTATGFLALFLAMALMGFGAGFALGGYGFEGSLLCGAVTLILLAVSTIRKPMWIHEMLSKSRAEDAKQDRKRSLALIGEIRGDRSVDSSQVHFLVALNVLLLLLSSELNLTIFFIGAFILTRKLISAYRLSTTLFRRITGLMVAPLFVAVLFWLVNQEALLLDELVVKAVTTFALVNAADEAFVLWNDLRRAKLLKAQIELLNAIQARIGQLCL